MSLSWLSYAPWLDALFNSLTVVNGLTYRGLNFPTNTPNQGDVLTMSTAANQLQWLPGGGGGGGSVVYETDTVEMSFYFYNENAQQGNSVGTANISLSRVGDIVFATLDLSSITNLLNNTNVACDSIVGIATVPETFNVPDERMTSNKLNLLANQNNIPTGFTYGSLSIVPNGDNINIIIRNDSSTNPNQNTSPTLFENGTNITIGGVWRTGNAIYQPPKLCFTYSVF